MPLSREIARKGEASGKPFNPKKKHPSRMLRPSAGYSNSYYKYVVVWRVTNWLKKKSQKAFLPRGIMFLSREISHQPT